MEIAPAFLKLLQRLSTPESVVLDVGAYQGAYSSAYRQALPQAKIYAFEPFPDLMAYLKQHFANDPRTVLVQKAVSDTNVPQRYYVNTFSATNSLLPRPAAGKVYYPEIGRTQSAITVATTTLDEFCAQEHLTSILLTKMDIQGNELRALKGSQRLLENQRIHILYLEVLFVPLYEANPKLLDLWQFLATFGYSLYDILDLAKADDGQLKYADAIFVSPYVRGLLEEMP